MAENSSHSINFQAIRELEQLRRQYGFNSVTELLADMGAIYAAAVTGLPEQGEQRRLRHIEAINLWGFAEAAAAEGHTLGVIAGTLGDNFELISTLMPGSLIEIRDEALEAAAAQPEAVPEVVVPRSRPQAVNLNQSHHDTVSS